MEVGSRLPERVLYGDPTFIVSTAIATRDYEDLHHDRDKAQAKGSKGIFVNILTDTGLVQRYVTDWAGPLCGDQFDRLTARGAQVCLRHGDVQRRGDRGRGRPDHRESHWQQQPWRDHVMAISTLTIGSSRGRSSLTIGGNALCPEGCRGEAAIAGIGATDFSKGSGRSELRLAAEAMLDALADAGLTPADADGMVTFTMDSNTEVEVARATGIGDLKFFSKIHYGGGAACATVQQATIAVATGVADCVVAYRASNERSGMRFGQVQLRLIQGADSTSVDNSFSYPHGLSTPAAQVAMIAKRYIHQ